MGTPSFIECSFLNLLCHSTFFFFRIVWFWTTYVDFITSLSLNKRLDIYGYKFFFFLLEFNRSVLKGKFFLLSLLWCGLVLRKNYSSWWNCLKIDMTDSFFTLIYFYFSSYFYPGNDLWNVFNSPNILFL